MGKWLALVLAVPTLAQAAPALDVSAVAPPTQASGQKAYYQVEQPVEPQYVPQGWSLYATLHGRSMDVGSRDWGGWSDEGRVQRRDIEAGYGWRSGTTTALIGYDQHDYGPDPALSPERRTPDSTEAPRFSGDGVLGFSFILHGR